MDYLLFISLFLACSAVVLAYLASTVRHFPPDVVIGDAYLLRWYLIPRNRWFNIYFHEFLHSDDDRALHDHPWYSVSINLGGTLIEHSAMGARRIPRYRPVFRSAKFAHRLEVVDGPVRTIFITGPRVRHWGFHCPKGWVPWEQFTDETGHRTGRGCE